MPEQNGSRTTNEWLMHIDEQMRNGFERVYDKLDGKTDKDDHEKLGSRLERVETRTRHLEIKHAGISAAIAGIVVWLKAQFFG